MDAYMMDSSSGSSLGGGESIPPYTLPDTSTDGTDLSSPPKVIPYEPLPERSIVSGANFDKQPPENLRKCSFFNFSLTLYDANKEPIELESASFLTFIEVTEEDRRLRNGVVYRLSLLTAEGRQKKEDIFVRLVDSSTKAPIAYEGTSKSPDLQRVLLTHVLICSRCCQRKSCGNKNETPSDPVLVNRHSLKIFLKCNQNCLKNAGNPSRTRRFQLAVYNSPAVNETPLAVSECMFVHNNSKHGKKSDLALPVPTTVGQTVPQMLPVILAICPNEGWTTGGSLICIIGENFFRGLQVIFGAAMAPTDYLTPNALSVRVPPRTIPGEVKITLTCKGSHYCTSAPGKFIYKATAMPTVEQGVLRLARIVKASKDMSVEQILQRSAELLETASVGGQLSSVNASPHMFQFPRSPFLPALPAFSIPPIMTATSGSTRMDTNAISTSSDMHQRPSSLSSVGQTSNEAYATPGPLDSSLSGGPLSLSVGRPRSCSLSDDTKSNHSTSCGSRTPASRCGSSDGLRHPLDHTPSGIPPPHLPPIHDQSPPAASPANDPMQVSETGASTMDYHSSKPLNTAFPFASNAWPNHQLQMRLPQFGVFPPSSSVTHPGMQFSALSHFPTAVGMNLPNNQPVADSSTHLDVTSVAPYKTLPFGMMACMQNSNFNNSSHASDHAPQEVEVEASPDGEQAILPPPPPPAAAAAAALSPSAPQQVPPTNFIPSLTMFPIMATSPHLAPLPTLPPKSPTLCWLPPGGNHSMPVTPTGVAPLGLLPTQRPLPGSPFALQTPPTAFVFPPVQQFSVGSPQEDTFSPAAVSRKRKSSDIDLSSCSH